MTRDAIVDRLLRIRKELAEEEKRLEPLRQEESLLREKLLQASEDGSYSHPLGVVTVYTRTKEILPPEIKRAIDRATKTIKEEARRRGKIKEEDQRIIRVSLQV